MKIVGDNIYVHITAIDELPEELRVRVERIRSFFKRRIGRPFQVVKVNCKVDRVSFLCYPKFWRQNFPELTESWTIDRFDNTFQSQHRRYNQDNPPILHRRELFIKANDKRRASMERVTRKCEEAGCFSDTKRIGRKQFWNTLLAQKGLSFA
jgi:hypothetical protein